MSPNPQNLSHLEAITRAWVEAGAPLCESEAINWPPFVRFRRLLWSVFPAQSLLDAAELLRYLASESGADCGRLVDMLWRRCSEDLPPEGVDVWCARRGPGGEGPEIYRGAFSSGRWEVESFSGFDKVERIFGLAIPRESIAVEFWMPVIATLPCALPSFLQHQGIAMVQAVAIGLDR